MSTLEMEPVKEVKKPVHWGYEHKIEIVNQSVTQYDLSLDKLFHYNGLAIKLANENDQHYAEYFTSEEEVQSFIDKLEAAKKTAFGINKPKFPKSVLKCERCDPFNCCKDKDYSFVSPWLYVLLTAFILLCVVISNN